MKSKIKNILFDFGGVIVSLDKSKAIHRFKEIGMTRIEEFLNEFRQSGIFLDYEEGKLNAEEFYAAFRELAGDNNITNEDIDSAWLAFLTGIPEYKFALLRELRKKYKVYLLSNTNPSVMGWAMTNDFSPEGKPISDFFDECFISFKLGHAKPDKKIYEEMLKQSDMNPAETFFLDDGPANIKAAEEFGFHAYLANQDEDLRKVFVDRGLLD